jgi:hypothetical protein
MPAIQRAFFFAVHASCIGFEQDSAKMFGDLTIFHVFTKWAILISQPRHNA